MKLQHAKIKLKLHMEKLLRDKVMFTAVLVGAVTILCMGITVAWYTHRSREADTVSAGVMKPYYLSLRNPSDTDTLQLSVGSLLQGKTKQIVFCVSSQEEAQVNGDTSSFEYALELIHTDNLALNYEIYPLEKAESGESGIIVAEDIITADGETTTIETTYWKKTASNGVATPLQGTDVSEERWEQTGLSDAAELDPDAAEKGIINRGTYISYGKTEEEGEEAVDNGLALDPGEGTYAAQYFVLEISWNIVSGFEKYDKETDMIYIVAKAVQPEPEKNTP